MCVLYPLPYFIFKLSLDFTRNVTKSYLSLPKKKRESTNAPGSWTNLHCYNFVKQSFKLYHSPFVFPRSIFLNVVSEKWCIWVEPGERVTGIDVKFLIERISHECFTSSIMNSHYGLQKQSSFLLWHFNSLRVRIIRGSTIFKCVWLDVYKYSYSYSLLVIS